MESHHEDRQPDGPSPCSAITATQAEASLPPVVPETEQVTEDAPQKSPTLKSPTASELRDEQAADGIAKSVTGSSGSDNGPMKESGSPERAPTEKPVPKLNLWSPKQRKVLALNSKSPSPKAPAGARALAVKKVTASKSKGEQYSDGSYWKTLACNN